MPPAQARNAVCWFVLPSSVIEMVYAAQVFCFEQREGAVCAPYRGAQNCLGHFALFRYAVCPRLSIEMLSDALN